MQEASDFRAESDALFALLEPLDNQDWGVETQFKRWNFNDIVAHLHFGNYAADLALQDSAAFKELGRSFAARKPGMSHLAQTHAWTGGLEGRELLRAWRDFYRVTSDHFAGADPRARVPWFGPSMSVRSSISARLMETWAHGQAIYDRLGRERENTDRIRHIAFIGINTFGWTFTNRGLAVPAAPPRITLTAPSGAIWEWHEGNRDNLDNLIEGSAIEFCQVVTQVRNIADTRLKVVGATANAWMTQAQCFAGPPENPPAPGSRFRFAARAVLD